MHVKRPAALPPIVRAALFVNVALVLAALVIPHMLASSQSGGGEAEGAAILFAIPMALIFVIGAWAAGRAYILARRQDRRMSWIAFAPLGMFVVGLLATVTLIYTEII